MRISTGDWIVIAAYLALNVAIAVYYRRTGAANLNQYFASGRSAPWWLTGTSMAATGFSVDTPLGLTGLIAASGIAGVWWSFSSAIGGVLVVMVFARLWRRSAALTDMEFTELRYSGRPAAFLRGFRSLYLAVVINCIVMGWVNLAMVKILEIALGVPRDQALVATLALMLVTCAVSSLAGLRGVLLTDFVQFVLMMCMSVALAFFAVRGVGGLSALTEQVVALDGGSGRLDFLPPPDSPWMSISVFLVYVGMNWWASWRPGGGPDGSGHKAQRMLSAKDEQHSAVGALWYAVARYVLRPWPWILVALVSLVAFPGLEDPESGYVLVMLEYLPPSLRGLMLAAFLAAYMSTISTHLNWGAGYLLNDVYRRFLKPAADERHYVRASQWATLALALVSAAVTSQMESITSAWRLMIVIGAGSGLVAILRWLWWRVNAWSEIAAMCASGGVSGYLLLGHGYDTGDPQSFADLMLITVPATTVVWLAVTLLTAPEPQDRLLAFYRRVRPYAVLWRPVARLATDVPTTGRLGGDLADWIAGCGLVYGLSFGLGKTLLDPGLTQLSLFILAAGCGYRLRRSFVRRDAENAPVSADGSAPPPQPPAQRIR